MYAWYIRTVDQIAGKKTEQLREPSERLAFTTGRVESEMTFCPSTTTTADECPPCRATVPIWLSLGALNSNCKKKRTLLFAYFDFSRPIEPALEQASSSSTTPMPPGYKYLNNRIDISRAHCPCPRVCCLLWALVLVVHWHVILLLYQTGIRFSSWTNHHVGHI